MQSSLPSIQRRILSSITIVLLVLTLILTASFGVLSYWRIETTLTERMNIAMEVAWESYLERPRQLEANLQVLADLPAFRQALAAGDGGALAGMLRALSHADFAAVVTADGEVVAHTRGLREGLRPPFPHLLSEAVRTGAAQLSSEQVDRSWVAAQMPHRVEQLAVPAGCLPGDEPCHDGGLVQVAVVPVAVGHWEGGLVAGILLNNTHHVLQAASDRMPGSYLSIALGGVRVAANISTESGQLPTGGQQCEELLRTVARGERYYGMVTLREERHYVVSDPIRNGAGQTIGALSVGLPPSGFAGLQREALGLILVSALAALLVGVGVANLVARRFARPIIWLEQNVLRLAQAGGTQQLHDALSGLGQTPPPLYSRETMALHQSFLSLARSLERLTRETAEYMERLEHDRQELQQLTAKLQEHKAMLEQMVAERTEELQQAVVELRRANSLKSQFLATMSHELRTPLNSVIGFSEMLVDELVGPIQPKQREYLEYILSSARHLLQLISDILDLSRIEQGKLILEMQPVLVPELVESVRAIVGPQAASAGLNLHVEVEPGIEAVTADPTRIKEVLYNLLSNAIKFTPRGGQVWVRVRAGQGEVLVEVEDTGIGMKPEDQQVVFDEFVQAESAYHRRFEGTGLGLPLSRKLVELHGGHIELQSELGKGTIVRFGLPVIGAGAGGSHSGEEGSPWRPPS